MRVFLNYVDGFAGRAIGKALSDARHQVIGTLRGKKRPTWLSDLYSSDPSEELKAGLLSADVIIFNLEDNQTDHALFALQELAAADYQQEKTFICLSSVMCWARSTSKPKNDDNGGVYVEEEFASRKPHPLYRSHVQVEKLVMKSQKVDKLKTYVVCAGILYGAGEDIFHNLFKMAWLCDPSALPVPGDGENIVPTIYVHDLAQVLTKIVSQPPEDVRYILAIDDSRCALKDILQAISTNLGTGKLRYLSKEETLAQLVDNWPLDVLQMDAKLAPGIVKELEDLQWKCQGGMVENIATVVDEFRSQRGLTPVMVVLHGPPAAGKTYLAQKIAKEYTIHHVKLQDSINEALRQGDEFSQQVKDALASSLDLRIPDDKLVEIVRRKLSMPPCQNQGFILDGFPKTYDQAIALFGDDKDKNKVKGDATGEEDEEVEEEEEEEAVPEEGTEGEVQAKDKKKRKVNINPDFVVSLLGPDDILKQRILALPEDQVEGTHNTEEGFSRRLKAFKERNTEDNTPINYFEDRECVIIQVDIKKQTEEQILKSVVDRIGPPHNYGPSEEEIQARAKKREMEESSKKDAARQEHDQKERSEADERLRRQKQEIMRLAEVESQEKEILELRSLPLRTYLMDNVIPTLTKGLIEVCKVRPEDPVDYLAEYLFSHSSEENLDEIHAA